VTPKASGLDISIINRSRSQIFPLTEVRRLILGTGKCIGSPPGEVTVLFTADAEIRALNKQFRGKDKATDVLSFPDGAEWGDQPPRIGDIVISIPAARRNAGKIGHSLRREISQLIIHGFLHLMGFDHEVDGGDMESLEDDLRGRLIKAAVQGRRK
jgi:rRNA maturation RNase YbeY